MPRGRAKGNDEDRVLGPFRAVVPPLVAGDEDDDLPGDLSGTRVGVHAGKIAKGNSLSDVDPEFTAVDELDQVPELGGVTAHEEVDRPHSPLVVTGRGHPHGGTHHDTAIPD